MTTHGRLPASVTVPQPAPEPDGGLVDIFSILRTLWRGKWWLLLFTLLGLTAGGYYAFAVAVPRYEARTIVALEDREGAVIDLESVMGGLSADQATINTEIEVMRSRQLVGKLVRNQELTQDPEFNPNLVPVEPWSLTWIKGKLLPADEATEPTPQEVHDATVDRLLEVISISNLRDSYVFNLLVQTTSPQKSAEIANALANLYILDQLARKFDATQKATEWLSEQVTALKAELEAAENELKDFTAGTELVSPEVLGMLNIRAKDLREHLASTQVAAEEVEARIAAIEGAMETATPAEVAALAGDAALDGIVERLQEGTVSRDAFDQRLDQVLQRARLDQAKNEQQMRVLQTSLAEIEDRIDRQSKELVTVQQLEREVEATALIYESFLTRLKEISVQQGLQEPDARVLSEAVVRKDPAAPQKGLILAISGLLGMFAGSGFVLARERMQNVFRTTEELERLTGVPVLGQIPQAPRARRKKLLNHMISHPSSAFSEAVRNLRTSILLSEIDNPPRVIMLTSSVPGEGKTTLSLSISQNLSLMGKKVLLIEADIRRRTFSEYFDIPEDQVGLVTAVAGHRPLSEIVFRTTELGMDILLGENSRVNAADFFSSKSFANFLDTAKADYDLVVLDTPPVLAVPDARVIGPQADAIIYVVHWDKTERTQVAAGLRAFHSLNLNVTGLVLSQIDPKGMKRYGYGSQYGNGAFRYYDS